MSFRYVYQPSLVYKHAKNFKADCAFWSGIPPIAPPPPPPLGSLVIPRDPSVDTYI